MLGGKAILILNRRALLHMVKTKQLEATMSTPLPACDRTALYRPSSTPSSNARPMTMPDKGTSQHTAEYGHLDQLFDHPLRCIGTLRFLEETKAGVKPTQHGG
ncbi:hypothetical protein V8E52_004667 [Russula decolorans]